MLGQLLGDTIVSGCNRITTLRALSLHMSIACNNYHDDNLGSPNYYIEVLTPENIEFSDYVLLNLNVARLDNLSLHRLDTTYALPELISSFASLRCLELL